MKKAIALLATLVVLTSTTFAQLAPTISGEASTYWGVDFATGEDADGASASGFENDTDITVTIPLVTDASVMSEGEGATGYGEITGAYIQLNLEDFNFGDYDDDEAVFDVDGDTYTDGITGSEGDISAKIDFGNGAYIVVGDITGLEADLVDGDADVDYMVSPYWDEGAGMTVGFSNDMASLEFTVANESDGYETDEDDDAYFEDDNDTQFFSDEAFSVEDYYETYSTTGDAYMIGANASYTAGDIFSLEAQFATNLAGDVDTRTDKTGVAAAVSTMVGPLSLTFPVDYLMQEVTDTETAMELFPSVSVSMDALTVGANFHYITIAKELLNSELLAYNTIVAAYNYSDAVDTSDDDYDNAEEIDYAKYFGDDYTAMILGTDVAYALEAGTVALSVDVTVAETEAGTSVDYSDADTATYTVVDDTDADAECEIELSWTGEGYSVTAGLDDVLQDEVSEGISFDATYTAIAGLDFSVETAFYGDSETFEVEALNVDFTSELTGVENTTFTVNWSDVVLGDDDDTTDYGIFYMGASIAF